MRCRFWIPAALAAFLCSCAAQKPPGGGTLPGNPRTTGWRFDFGTTETTSGYVAVGRGERYTPARGYGWIDPPDVVRDRGRPDAVRRDFVFSRRPATFRVDVNPGVYRIALMMGDQEYGDHVLKASLSPGAMDLPVLEAAPGEFATVVGAFPISAPHLVVRLDSPTNNWVLTAMTLERVSSPESPRVIRERPMGGREVGDPWRGVRAWPDPIAPYVERFRRDAATCRDFAPTGLSRNDYLALIGGDVDYFKIFQDAHGAILDPVKKIEWQYSTPCFALASATLVVHAGRADLLEPAANAMDWSVQTLSQRKAATAHEDFFPPQIAHALLLLRPHVAPERYDSWIATLRGIDPSTTYRAGCGRGNWNVAALSGEGLFYRMRVRDSPAYVEECMAGQGGSFHSFWGLYTEGPMAYDHFPRMWAADLLAAGYVGQNTDGLAEVLRRGALTSLFMQSPAGELPTGGRSAHHQWNEAQQCVTYEIYAARARETGDLQLAGAYKRAAHLALRSVRRWIRPSGELWIVKNRFDPAEQWGYESYSAHSQYNLLAMAMLSIAFEHASTTEDVAETPAPADVGGFVITLPPPHNKVFANAGGMYVELDCAADLNYNATGLLRVHSKNGNPQLGPSDALTSHAVYHLPECPRVTAAVGPAWLDREGRWQCLAESGRSRDHPALDRSPRVSVRTLEERPERVEFEVTYDKDFQGPSRIVERYVLTPEQVELEARLVDYAGPVRMVWPVLANDGVGDTDIRVEKNRVEVSLGKDSEVFLPVGARNVRVGTERYAFRNGWARLGVAEYPPGGSVILRVRSGGTRGDRGVPRPP